MGEHLSAGSASARAVDVIQCVLIERPEIGKAEAIRIIEALRSANLHVTGNAAQLEKMPVARPVAFRVPRVIDDKISETEFRLFDDEEEARRAACCIGADYDGLFLVADRRAAFFAQPDPRLSAATGDSGVRSALALRLRDAAQTAQNDDLSKPYTEKRQRHVMRVEAMLDAAEYLEEVVPAEPQGVRK